MKSKISIVVLSLLIPIMMFAQKDVTTFLGIPIDGYKSEMRKKLISKGFTPNKLDEIEYFEGEFNGTDVHLYIGTNNNKVYRIMLCDVKTMNEADIINRFNNLVRQFEKNNRYITLQNYAIPNGEDISYEMLVHNKTYEALYYQNPDYDKVDTVALKNQMQQAIYDKYTQEELENLTEEQRKDVFYSALGIGFDLIFKKPVWFRISEHCGEYYITMFYDNEYNHADGEDL